LQDLLLRKIAAAVEVNFVVGELSVVRFEPLVFPMRFAQPATLASHAQAEDFCLCEGKKLVKDPQHSNAGSVLHVT